MSTYTSELRLEKIGTGEQSGSWGTTTNTQYDILESAISGTINVAFASNGNDALTTANGSDDEARHMVINLTGGSTLDATRDMVVPTSAKLYIIRNGTTGGQSVRIIGASGNGITIPNGKTMFLRHDGTNVVDASDYFTAITTPSATITGGTIAGVADIVVSDTSPQLGGNLDVNSKFINGDLISDTDSTDSFGSTGVRWLKGWFDTLTAGTLTIGAGSIVDSSGAIDFGDEVLKTTGTIELGHATDTTIARVSAGVVSVEGDTVSLLATAQTFSKAQSGSITALSDGANISVDLSTNNHFSVTLGGNRTLDNPTNIVAGTSGSFFITQDGTGSRTLAYGSHFDFAGGTAPTLSTAASAVDRIDYIARTTSSLHCVFTGALS
tara:strand:- start:71 stop:1216 length:1146 start_codon:yes stop_codon:yes gene_type:complete